MDSSENKKKYEKGKLNIMVAKDFKERIDKIQKKFSVKFNTYAIYVLLDRAYISNIEKIYGSDGADTEYSYERRGKNENKKQMFRTITFNKSYHFADVIGIVNKETKGLNARAYFEISDGGAVKFSLDMKPAELENVNIKVITELMN